MNQSEVIWEKLSQVAVTGAEYDSPERRPHPSCLRDTRVNLLDHIYGLLGDEEKNQLIWLNGTAGVGKSAVAFTVAAKMRSLKVGTPANNEKRLAGTFFFSRRYTRRCMTNHFFATLAYQLATNFPSIKDDLTTTIRENPTLLNPGLYLRNQMEGLFLQPLRRLQNRLRGCQPLVFVVDALDECTSKEEIVELISLLGGALHDPDLPVTKILLTSRSEAHIREAIREEEMHLLVYEIPAEFFGVTLISLDGADVDNDIYIFLEHSFTKLRRRCPNFPQPTQDELTLLASRAGRRFIVASTMVNFIDDKDNDPRDRLQVMLQLTCKLLPGMEAYKLYDLILSTCSDPKRAYLHLSVVAALANPLPISQISELLGPGEGKDVETALVQLRSVMDIPTDSSLPVNIYHSSVRDYVSSPWNCGLFEKEIVSSHSLLAYSSLKLMIQHLPESTGLLDALVELREQSKAMESHPPQNSRNSLAFIVEPPTALGVVVTLLWLRGDRSSQLYFWLEAPDGRAWLRTQEAKDWLQTPSGREWLRTPSGREWLRTLNGREQWLPTPSGQVWLQTQSGQAWLRTRGGRGWLQTLSGQEWLQTPSGREWLPTPSEQEWLPTPSGRAWREWLQTPSAQEWLQTPSTREWLQSLSGREWLQSLSGQEWLQTPRGQAWQSTPVEPVLVNMEEFFDTVEAVSKFIIIPELSLLPAFRVIEQFKSLPDFLMLPVLLSSTHPQSTTSALVQGLDVEIIHAIKAFVSFTNEARERSQSASNAVTYACRNWMMHLSRAPNPWNNILRHVFEVFWDGHLLSWLERQWCLTGLQSCLMVLSEGQNLANHYKTMSGLSLWLVPNAIQRQLIQQVSPKQPKTRPRPMSTTSYPEITPHITLASSRGASKDTMLRALPSPLRLMIPVEFQKLEVGDHYFRSVFMSVKKTAELMALHGYIMTALERDGASPSAPVSLHMDMCYIADEDGDAERKRAADELRASAVVERSETGGAETDALRCGDSEQGHVWLSGFDGAEVWIVQCDGPVEDWQVLQKVSTAPDVA